MDTLITVRERAFYNKNEPTTKPFNKERTFTNVATTKTTKGKGCIICKNGKHQTFECTNMKIPEKTRFQMIKEAKLCLYCLRTGHMKKDCRNYKARNITCSKCNSKSHHSLMHSSEAPTYKKPNYQENRDKTNNSTGNRNPETKELTYNPQNQTKNQ